LLYQKSMLRSAEGNIATINRIRAQRGSDGGITPFAPKDNRATSLGCQSEGRTIPPINPKTALPARKLAPWMALR
jgi:hypothetical protein